MWRVFIEVLHWLLYLINIRFHNHVCHARHCDHERFGAFLLSEVEKVSH